MQSIAHGLQWCCSGGSWENPHQFQASRWLYIQPQPLVSSSFTKLLDLKSANTVNDEGLHLIRIRLCGLLDLP